MKMKVYTCVLGATDPLRDPKVANPNVDYICYSDKPQRSKVWKIVPFETNDPLHDSRKIKILSHKYAGDCDVSLWLDAAYELLVDPVELVNYWMKDADMLAMKHPHRSDIADEAEAIIELGLAPKDQVYNQLNYYRSKGFCEQKQITSTGFCIRKHVQKVIDFNNLWYDEVRQWTYRDQLSVDYVLSLVGLNVVYLAGHYRNNPYAKWRLWRSPSSRRQKIGQ